MLEVVLALALFAAAAGIIMGGFHSSLSAARQLQIQSQAMDLAVTVLSEVQIGMIPASDSGPNAFEDPELAEWTWAIVVTPAETRLQGAALRRVEVIIANKTRDFTHRLAELIADESSVTATAVPIGPSVGEGAP